MCWQQIGYMMIIYIARLQAKVPGDMVEGRQIDSATKMQTLFKVIIPQRIRSPSAPSVAHQRLAL